METLELFWLSALTVWLFMTFGYLMARYLKNLGLVDVMWGIGFMLIALTVLTAVGDNMTQSFVVVWSLVMLWGSRLALHIGSRFNPSKEDWRYQTLRKSWGSSAWWQSYIKVFMLQGLLMLAVGVPIYLSPNIETSSLQITGGIIIWLAGFLFEVIGDYQLKLFIKTKKKNDFIKTGLWKYTRHPNYFGEVVQWWGLFIVVASYNWYVAIISPVVITVLILKISGIPMLEKRWEGNKHYEKYAKVTNEFFPWFPKSQ